MNIIYVCLNFSAYIILVVKLAISIHTIIHFTCATFVYKRRVCYIGLYYTDMLPSGACVRA